MSDHQDNNFQGVDNLTPFEYALAGVAVPEAQDSPSLAVVEHMRMLAAEVEDAPIVHPGLGEFIDSGGSIARRSDRRSMRRRRPATSPEAVALAGAEGGFIDITPIELAESNEAASKANGQATDDAPPPEPVPVAADGATPVIDADATVTAEAPASGSLELI
ncbi:MAG: hypothetical protein ACR2QK_18685, partial [Acidimicrobiales bacterium]